MIAAEDRKSERIRGDHRVTTSGPLSRLLVKHLRYRETGTNGLGPHGPVIRRRTGKPEHRTAEIHAYIPFGIMHVLVDRSTVELHNPRSIGRGAGEQIGERDLLPQSTGHILDDGIAVTVSDDVAVVVSNLPARCTDTVSKPITMVVDQTPGKLLAPARTLPDGCVVLFIVPFYAGLLMFEYRRDDMVKSLDRTTTDIRIGVGQRSSVRKQIGEFGEQRILIDIHTVSEPTVFTVDIAEGRTTNTAEKRTVRGINDTRPLKSVVEHL